jgi:hypothetical protein
MKKIPSKFSLLGLDIKVQQLPYDALQKKNRELAANAGRNADDTVNVLGLCDHGSGTLYIIAKDLKRWSEEFRLSVFHHELAHGLLYMAGRGDLSSDEALVDVLGNLILQADKTAVYE